MARGQQFHMTSGRLAAVGLLKRANIPIPRIVADMAPPSRLQPTLGVSSLDLGRPLDRPFFIQKHVLATPAQLTSLAGCLRGWSGPDALAKALLDSYATHSRIAQTSPLKFVHCTSKSCIARAASLLAVLAALLWAFPP